MAIDFANGKSSRIRIGTGNNVAINGPMFGTQYKMTVASAKKTRIGTSRRQKTRNTARAIPVASVTFRTMYSVNISSTRRLNEVLGDGGDSSTKIKKTRMSSALAITWITVMKTGMAAAATAADAVSGKLLYSSDRSMPVRPDSHIISSFHICSARLWYRALCASNDVMEYAAAASSEMTIATATTIASSTPNGRGIVQGSSACPTTAASSSSVVTVSISLAPAVETAAGHAVKAGDGLGERSDNIRQKNRHHQRHDHGAQPDDKKGDQRETSDKGKKSKPRRLLQLEVELFGKAPPTVAVTFGWRLLLFAPHLEVSLRGTKKKGSQISRWQPTKTQKQGFFFGVWPRKGKKEIGAAGAVSAVGRRRTPQ
eukprot:scaffold60436_cov38-Phaeocystis_antarctica.AAC.3